jgi:hypothetical protein
MNDLDPRYAPPPRRGLSTGAKIGIGCGIILFLALIAAGLLVYYVQHTFEQLSGGTDAHIEATATFERLANRYPFTPPADDVVGADQASTFVTVSEEIWRELGPSVEKFETAMRELSQDEGRPDVRAVSEGFRGLARVTQVRLMLADLLERQQMSAEEYAWVGRALAQAHRALDDPSAGTVPEANLELARTYRAELAGFRVDDDYVGKGWLLLMAENTELSPELFRVFARPGR